MIKIGDASIVATLLIIITILFGTGTKKSDTVLIRTHEKDLMYNINENRIIELNGMLGKTLIKIENKEIYFFDSACPDKLCIKDGVLKNMPLICMPNYITITFTTVVDKESGVTIDSFVR